MTHDSMRIRIALSDIWVSEPLKSKSTRYPATAGVGQMTFVGVSTTASTFTFTGTGPTCSTIVKVTVAFVPVPRMANFLASPVGLYFLNVSVRSVINARSTSSTCDGDGIEKVSVLSGIMSPGRAHRLGAAMAPGKMLNAKLKIKDFIISFFDDIENFRDEDRRAVHVAVLL